MPKFQYTAVNQQNKKLTGIIDAKSEDEARRELNTLGFSIFSMEEKKGIIESENTQITKLRFEALDRMGKKILGSVRSSDIFLAYTKLIEEYQFKVLNMYPENATVEEIQHAKEEGIKELEARYQQSKQKTLEKKSLEKMEDYEKKRQKLLKEVDGIVQTIQKVLENNGDRMRMDMKADIKKDIDKLTRLRTSKNIEYIEQIVNEIVRSLQKPEIFSNPEENKKSAIELKITTNHLLKHLNQSMIETRSLREEILEKIKNWQNKNINGALRPNFFHRLINTFLEIIHQRLYQDEETKDIWKQLKKNRSDLIEWLKIWILGDSLSKEVIKPMIQKTWEERKALKQSLKKYPLDTSMPAESAEMRTEKKHTLLNNWLNELSIFTGWLMVFYLTYYFMSSYAIIKNLDIKLSPKWYLLKSPSFRYFFVGIFIFHITVSALVHFFQKKTLASIILFPLSITSIILIIYNF